MTQNSQFSNLKQLGVLGAWAVIVFGIFLRFQSILTPNFFIFDEGYYLKFNYRFLSAVAAHPPADIGEWARAFWTLIRVSLGTGKPLWFVLIDGRVLWGGIHFWAFPRLVSAVVGIAALYATYRFTEKFSKSKMTALLTVAILSVLPSHVFYSRLALQEALSGLFFLGGIYFYLYPQRFGPRTFLSAALLNCAYLTNYRLIFIPFAIACVEIFCCFFSGEKKSIKEAVRKYFWNTLVFVALVLLIGCMDQGQNMRTIYAWTMHQSSLAEGHRAWFNFLSYPYYLFRLESLLFGALFFANLYFVVRKEWQKSFPFLFALLLMAIFSLTSDRAARYICVGLPFMCMAVASMIMFCLKEKTGKIPPTVSCVVTVLLIFSFFSKSVPIAFAQSDYRTAINLLKRGDPEAKVLSTQPWVQKLFVRSDADVQEASHAFKRVVEWYLKGYRYLILDPQAYISFTESGIKFDPRLKGPLGVFDKTIKPIRTFPHFNAVVLERFVFEHNENLWDSVMFLRHNREHLGSLRIYDMKEYAESMIRQLAK